MRHLFVFAFALFYLSQVAASELVVFSKDRPMQLYAFLESTYKHVTGLSKIHILYRTTETKAVIGYKICFNEFGNKLPINCKKQKKGFKGTLEKILRSVQSQHIIFGVDDIIVKSNIDLNHCAKLLDRYNTYGFHLRLGNHIDRCHSAGIDSPPPPFTEVEPGVLLFPFDVSKGDWNYPCTLDMALYKTTFIRQQFATLRYHSPNSLEGNWAGRQAGSLKGITGLCFTTSKVINLPLNVTRDNASGGAAHMNLSVKKFIDLFLNGYKLDITAVENLRHNTCHFELIPPLVRR